MFAETHRLIIRDLQNSDLAGLLAISIDPDVVQMMEGYLPQDEAELRPWITSAIEHNEEQPRRAHNSAIVLRTSGDMIGWIGFELPDDLAKGNIEFGYALNRAYRNQGYMTEAVTAMLAYCFEVLGASAVTAYHMDFNPGSGRVMQKAGMSLYDAIMQGRSDGQVHYIVTVNDWNAHPPKA